MHKLCQLLFFITSFGGVSALPGWSSTGAQCDDSAVMVAPGWNITRSGGHCMNDKGSKGFAVALVSPPVPVKGCPGLCILMGHLPGDMKNDTSSHDTVSGVCGGAEAKCMIAIGDWNKEDIAEHWNTLVGGSTTLVEPDERTCCHPVTGFKFDHTATNIEDARSDGHTIFDYQLGKCRVELEHKPVSLMLRLPGTESFV